MLSGQAFIAGFNGYFKSNVLRSGILALAYFLTARMGFELPLMAHSTGLFWPPAGLALAALLLFGARLWPGVLLGALLTHLASGLPPVAVIGISFGSTAEAWLGAYLLRRYSRFNTDLNDVADIFRLLFWGAMVSTFFCAANGVFWLAQQGVISWQLYTDAFAFWWMGDMLGVMLFAPALIGFSRPAPFEWTSRMRKLAAMLGATLVVLCLLVFTDLGVAILGYQPKSYLLFPVIVCAALCFDFRVLSSALLIVYFATFYSMSNEAGVFSRNSTSEAIDVWMYNMLLNLVGLVVLLVNEQRNRIHKDKFAQNIHSLSNYDALTGLPNRSLLHDRITQLLAAAHRDNQKFALLYLDLDRFKHVNNSMGHGVGDKLLQVVATRLHKCVREVDTVSRIGGDEFILLLRETDADGAARVANRLLKSLIEPYNINLIQISTNASIGISVYPDNAEDADTLIRHADVAMYRAKEEGRNNIQFFTQEMNSHSNQLFFMETDLRLAIENNEFSLHYQPQVDLMSGRICGAEALIRWKHPVRDWVSPAEFIPVAEETGQIIAVGEWVLRTACMQLAAWRRQGIPVFPMAVNLSIRQLRQPGLAQLVAAVLKETGLHPDDLELEITESIMMTKVNAAMNFLTQMHKLGVQLSIDDFGTGYSSLSYLKKLPVNTLKIDQSFVRDIGIDDNDASIVRSIISLGHQFNLQVIAEGVETLEQLNFLRERGCDEMQGYYFSRPLPPAEFLTFISSSPVLQ